MMLIVGRYSELSKNDEKYVNRLFALDEKFILCACFLRLQCNATATATRPTHEPFGVWRCLSCKLKEYFSQKQ